MKKITKVIVSVIGEYPYLLYLEYRNRYYPSSLQKEILKIDKVLMQNRISFYSSFIKPGDLCFDVGSNVGNRISPLLAIGASIVAIEPQKALARFLKFKFGKRINVVQMGIGSEVGLKTLYVAESSYLSSFSEEWIEGVKNERFKNNKWNRSTIVKMTTLDSLISIYGEPSFIKIDVEGFELEVLKGLNRPIKLISFEYTVPEQTNKIFECIDEISKNKAKYECNYSSGESMIFELKEWISIDDFKKMISQKLFNDADFGDIYIRKVG